MLETITQALINTPWWVYVLFIYLIFVGVRALKTHVVPLSRLVIIPVLFTWMSIHSLLSALPMTTVNLSAWILFLLLGSAVGWIQVSRLSIRVDKKKWLLEIPGSINLLVLILIIFASKYYFEYNLAVNPERITHLDFAIAMIAVYSIVTGLFLGRFFCYVYRMLTQTQVDLQED